MIKYSKCKRAIHLESPYGRQGIFCKVIRNFDPYSYSTTRFRLEVTCKNCLFCIIRGDIEHYLETKYEGLM